MIQLISYQIKYNFFSINTSFYYIAIKYEAGHNQSLKMQCYNHIPCNLFNNITVSSKTLLFSE